MRSACLLDSVALVNLPPNGRDRLGLIIYLLAVPSLPGRAPAHLQRRLGHALGLPRPAAAAARGGAAGLVWKHGRQDAQGEEEEEAQRYDSAVVWLCLQFARCAVSANLVLRVFSTRLVLAPAPPLQQAFKGLKSLLMVSQFTHLSPEGNSDLLAAMRYPITDPARPPQPAPAAVAAEAAVAAAVVDLSGHDASPGSAAGAGAALAAKGMRVAWPGDFSVPAVAKERPQVGRTFCVGTHAVR